VTSVFQTRFGEDGNCLAACIASICEVPLDDVPQPTREELASVEQWHLYLVRLHEGFLWARGVYLLPVSYLTNTAQSVAPMGYSILTGRSPRTGGYHSVVCFDGEVVHDPHPQGKGELGEWHNWQVFVSLDPR